MRTKRGIAQVVFNYLPDQTVDLAGSIWRVARWVEPRVVPIDETVLRAELLRAIYPWTASGRDSGLGADLMSERPVVVVQPSDDGYVSVEPFPLNFRCSACGRIEQSPAATCRCGAGKWRQLGFVWYHECGRSDTPYIPRCQTHNQVRVNTPTSAATSDLVFECPVCGHELARGFRFIRCDCGNGTLRYNVHRAAVVFQPRSTVVVNPPTQAKAQALRAAGARDRVLDWVLHDMKTREPLSGAPSVGGLIAQLVESGLSEAAARAAAEAAAEASGSELAEETLLGKSLKPDRREAATESALQLAYATAGGRIRVDDLTESAGPAMLARYTHSYPETVSAAGLSAVELLDDFPVLDAVYGYTRGASTIGESTLRPFRGAGGSMRVHGQLSHTEALLFRLDPIRVGAWLHARGLLGSLPTSGPKARLAILEAADIPRPADPPQQPTVGAELLALVHTLSHRVMRRASAFCGIDRDSLSEYLSPLHLSFAIFAASRGDFVLGGLQALFEHDLDHMLHDLVFGESRCALDPGCASHGSACVACLHVGEPSCRYFNQYLSRDLLFGAQGYLGSAATG